MSSGICFKATWPSSPLGVGRPMRQPPHPLASSSATPPRPHHSPFFFSLCLQSFQMPLKFWIEGRGLLSFSSPLFLPDSAQPQNTHTLVRCILFVSRFPLLCSFQQLLSSILFSNPSIMVACSGNPLVLSFLLHIFFPFPKWRRDIPSR